MAGDQKSISPGTIVIHKSRWEDICDTMRSRLEQYHSDFPLRIGMPVEEFRSRLDLPSKFLPLVMSLAEAQSVIAIREKWVASSDFQVSLSPEQDSAVDAFIKKADQSGFSPPSVKECRAEIGDDLFQYLLDSEMIVRVSEDVLFTRDQYERAVEWVKSEMSAQNTLSVADVRNGLGTTRKYALALSSGGPTDAACHQRRGAGRSRHGALPALSCWTKGQADGAPQAGPIRDDRRR